jgi:SpoVK/Ycf46/Vps4 family AAA+-type ATPase
MSNLLSFLDNPPTFMYKAKNGVRYPVSIVIATTNYYDRLDEAVKREGRFDLKINMSYFDKNEAQEMCDLYGLKLEDLVGKIESDDWRMSPSELQALCIENVDSELKKVN